MTTSHSDHWVCLKDDDYVIDRFELRIKGRKPLVLNQSSFSKLFYNVQQYLNINQSQAKVKVSVVDTPTPITTQEHMSLLYALVQ
ncbi:hypothetical protein [Vibrio mediterranei]|uniref:hypothetical protein n=1 Tax=Vibrio mediterranei TaxID=689 RepID=UPI00228478A2|nr:hypothetical protein [Vibrio mediterranei]MCY9855122.1 hypothetical protein [Vibrio mediterranei]